jgi:hypothetical protein
MLSTATPAINAWLNPAHRAIVATRNLLHKLEFRISAVIACLLAEALQSQQGHQKHESKYNMTTSLSRTLADDPSCRLLTILRQYLETVDLASVEQNVQSATVPQLSTIRKGLVALVRQWKTVLHMPAMASGGQKGLASSQRRIKVNTARQQQNAADADESDERTSLLQPAQPGDGASSNQVASSQHFPSNQSLGKLPVFSRYSTLCLTGAESFDDVIKRSQNQNMWQYMRPVLSDEILPRVIY